MDRRSVTAIRGRSLLKTGRGETRDGCAGRRRGSIARPSTRAHKRLDICRGAGRVSYGTAGSTLSRRSRSNRQCYQPLGTWHRGNEPSPGASRPSCSFRTASLSGVNRTMTTSAAVVPLRTIRSSSGAALTCRPCPRARCVEPEHPEPYLDHDPGAEVAAVDDEGRELLLRALEQ